MGVEPRWKGLNTFIPVVMVSKRAYSILVAESYTGGIISFLEEGDVQEQGQATINSSVFHIQNRTINSNTWETLEKLHKGEVGYYY
jgi:hypothetical protein